MNKKDFYLVFFAIILYTLASSIVSPMFSIYLQFLGISVSVIGFVIIIHNVSSGLFDPFGGELTDRVGKKKLLIFSFLAWSIIYLLYLVPNFYLILMLRVVHGIITALIGVCMWGYINEYLRNYEDKGKKYTLLSIFWMLPGFVGPVVGGLLFDISPHFVFVVSSIITLLSVFLLFFVPNDKKKEKVKDGIKQSIKDGIIFDDLKEFLKTNLYVKISSFITFVLSFDGGFSATFLPLILVDYFYFDPAFVGFLFSLNTFFIFGIRILQYKEYKKLNGNSLVFSLVLMFISYALLPFVSKDLFVIIFLLSSFYYGLIFPLAFERFTNHLPKYHRGEIIGVNEMLKQFGSILGLVLGSIVSFFNLKYGFIVISGLYLLSAIFSLKFRGVVNDKSKNA